MATKRWKDIRAKKFTAAERKRLDAERDRTLIDMDLAEIRAIADKTQVEVAEALEMGQGDVSRLEHRRDYLVSTLRRYVEALGGEIEIIARIGDRRVRLRAAG